MKEICDSDSAHDCYALQEKKDKKKKDKAAVPDIPAPVVENKKKKEKKEEKVEEKVEKKKKNKEKKVEKKGGTVG